MGSTVLRVANKRQEKLAHRQLQTTPHTQTRIPPHRVDRDLRQNYYRHDHHLRQYYRRQAHHQHLKPGAPEPGAPDRNRKNLPTKGVGGPKPTKDTRSPTDTTGRVVCFPTGLVKLTPVVTWGPEFYV